MNRAKLCFYLLYLFFIIVGITSICIHANAIGVVNTIGIVSGTVGLSCGIIGLISFYGVKKGEEGSGWK